MFNFEEYVMFSVLREDQKKELAEKFAEKRLSPEEVKVNRQLGQSSLELWLSKQLS